MAIILKNKPPVKTTPVKKANLKKSITYKGGLSKTSPLESNPKVILLVTTKWSELTLGYSEALAVVGYLRGIMTVERALHNTSSCRELMFLINIANTIIKEKFQ